MKNKMTSKDKHTMQSYICIVASPKVDKESGSVNVTARTVNNRIWNSSASEAISMRSKCDTIDKIIITITELCL